MKISIKFVLLAALVGLQLIAVSVILLSSYVTSEKAVLKQAQRLMLETAENTIRHSRNFLQPAEAAVELSQRLQRQGVVSGPAMEQYFFEQLQAIPQMSGIYYGDERGDFTFVNRSTDVKNAQFRTKFISRSGALPKASFIYRNELFDSISSSLNQTETFDPRQRPWYKKVRAEDNTVWTDPYIFYSTQRPGITVATPVHDGNGGIQGVIGIDIEIAEISEFLADLEIGKSGTALVLGTNGDVIAHPDPSKIKKVNDGEGNGMRFATIDEIDDPIARAAVAALGGPLDAVNTPTMKFARFEVGSDTYDAVFAPIQVGNLHWTLAIYVPEKDFLGAIIQKRNQNIVIVLIIALVTVLIGLLISRSITRSLSALSDCADELARGEEPDTLALPGNFTEVQHVGTAFRRMTRWLNEYRVSNQNMHDELLELSRGLEIRVEERTSALQEANSQLRREIAERAEAERQLAVEVDRHKETSERLWDALDNADEASMAKSRFLSSMSHELRTPLNAIIGFAQLLDGQAGEIDEQKKSDYAKFILSSSDRLLGLINQVLDLAGIESGKILLSLEAVEPTSIIRRVVDEMSVLAKASEITLYDDTAGVGLPDVSADGARTAQALVNLVANAIKYNRTGGEVRLSAQINGENLRFSVSDNGLGIHQNKLDQVFETFNRLGAEQTMLEGSGVGLSLTKQFIEKMGGEIGFESVRHEGSTFWFELPLAHNEPQDTAGIRKVPVPNSARS